MNRDLWLNWNTKDSFPAWPCPKCGTGSLRMKDLTLEEAASSKQLGPDAPPWEYAGRFHGSMECNRPNCAEAVVVLGDASVDADYDETGTQFFETYYRATTLRPAPPMFVPPKRCPNDVQKELVRTFALYWSDPPAAANALRSCIERILNHRHVRKTIISRGSRRQLALHARIEVFQQQNARMSAALMAIKWIGNEGSHAGSLTQGDVLDGVDVIENVVDELWGDKEKKLAKIIAKINRSRKPRSRQRHKRIAMPAKKPS